MVLPSNTLGFLRSVSWNQRVKTAYSGRPVPPTKAPETTTAHHIRHMRCSDPLSFQLALVKLETRPGLEPIMAIPFESSRCLQGSSKYKTPASTSFYETSDVRHDLSAKTRLFCMHRFSSWLMSCYISRILRESGETISGPRLHKH